MFGKKMMHIHELRFYLWGECLIKYSHIFVSDVAFIQYDKYNSILDYYETQVPPTYQGKGIAQILAKVNDFINA